METHSGPNSPQETKCSVIFKIQAFLKQLVVICFGIFMPFACYFQKLLKKECVNGSSVSPINAHARATQKALVRITSIFLHG